MATASISRRRQRLKTPKKNKMKRLGDLEPGELDFFKQQKEERRASRRQLKAALAKHSVKDVLKALVSAAEDSNTSEGVAELLPKVVKFVAEYGNEADYRQVLWCCTRLPFQLNPAEFGSLLRGMLARIPIHSRSVRLTLNLAIPRDGQVVFAEPEQADEGSPGSQALSLVDGEEKLLSIDRVQAARIAGPPLAELCGRVLVYDREMAAYFGHFTTLITLEYLSQIEALQKTWKEKSGSQLEVTGQSIRNLKVVQVALRRVALVPPWEYRPQRSRFKPGDMVFISRGQNGPLQSRPRDRATGVLIKVPLLDGERDHGEKDQFILLGQFDGIDLSGDGVWRMDEAPNQVAYTRQWDALLQLATTRDCERQPLMELIAASPDSVGVTRKRPWARRMLRAAMDREAPEEPDDGAALVPTSRMEQLARHVVPLKGCTDTALSAVRKSLDQSRLNRAQRTAVEAALGRRLTLVQGPPGTGKTHVAVHLLKLWSKRLNLRPILATSDSHVAVDNIAEGLVRQGVKVVRIGQDEKITKSLHDLTMNARLEKFRASQDRTLGEWSCAAPARNLRLVQLRHGDIDQNERQRIMADADVVCATTIAAGSDLLKNVKFGALLVDEVAQATEPAVMVPIVRGDVERVVLVGDHCQLAPVVECHEAEQRGLSLSLFSRLVGCGIEPLFLDTQFRMHSKIAEHIADEFYGGRLHTGVPDARRPPPQGFLWPRKGCGIAFLDIPGHEQDEAESRYNATEATLLVDVLSGVLAARELKPQDIGIITPYKAQVRLLRKAIASELGPHLQSQSLNPLYRDQGGLEVASVDAFQGREKELIIISTVRSNESGRLGFLQDWRRLNVMLTRARRGLIVIGDSATLRHDPSWERWIQWVEQSGFRISR